MPRIRSIDFSIGVWERCQTSSSQISLRYSRREHKEAHSTASLLSCGTSLSSQSHLLRVPKQAINYDTIRGQGAFCTRLRFYMQSSLQPAADDSSKDTRILVCLARNAANPLARVWSTTASSHIETLFRCRETSKTGYLAQSRGLAGVFQTKSA